MFTLFLTLGARTASAGNVLVIVADDLGADKVDGFADYSTTPDYLPSTPTLDALRAAGVTYTSAWASPECSPTRAGLHTGYPSYTHGIGSALGSEDPGLVDASWSTLGEQVTASGVAAAAFGKWHLGTTGSAGTIDWELVAGDPAITRAEIPHPGQAGFQAYVGDLDGGVDAYDGWTRVTFPGSSGAASSDLEWSTDNVDDTITDEALDWIGAQGGAWYAMVNYHSPHVGGTGPARGDVYDGIDEYDASCPESDACVSAGTCADLDSDGDNADDIANIVFRDLTECMDARIDTLLDGIDPAVLEDTVVVFMGDNGTPEEALEGDYADDGGREANGKGSVYETGVRIPLIVTDGETWLDYVNGQALSSDVYPNPGTTSTTGTTTVDLHDTVLDLLEISRPRFHTTASHSLYRPLTAGRPYAQVSSYVYTEIFNNDWATNGVDDDSAAAIKQRDNKLVANVTDDGAGSVCVVLELYGIGYDSTEQYDISGAQAATVTSMWYLMTNTVNPPWLPRVLCP